MANMSEYVSYNNPEQPFQRIEHPEGDFWRTHFWLSDRVFDGVKLFRHEREETVTELVRKAISLLHVANQYDGEKLFIYSELSQAKELPFSDELAKTDELRHHVTINIGDSVRAVIDSYLHKHPNISYDHLMNAAIESYTATYQEVVEGATVFGYQGNKVFEIDLHDANIERITRFLEQ